MTDLEQLALRCEAASGPDKFLGREVLLACGKGFVSPLYRWLDPTASIDAAMSLVPEGWAFDLVQQLPPARNTARVYGSKGQVTDLHYGATPALALCAASLRARSA